MKTGAWIVADDGPVVEAGARIFVPSVAVKRLDQLAERFGFALEMVKLLTVVPLE